MALIESEMRLGLGVLDAKRYVLVQVQEDGDGTKHLAYARLFLRPGSLALDGRVNRKRERAVTLSHGAAKALRTRLPNCDIAEAVVDADGFPSLAGPVEALPGWSRPHTRATAAASPILLTDAGTQSGPG